MAKRKQKTTKTGTLRIGNQWNAINIIGRSQTHPLKAVCELAENAIDAKSQHVQIVRRRSKGDIYLEVADDGQGVLPNREGEPDFERIATHVCDSMKRHLEAEERNGIHGEFGIGLLSFWSLGHALRMLSSGSNGRLFEMLLERGKRKYSIRPARGALPTGGTRVIVGPLLESTKKVVTGDKLVRYLSTELRDRIRASAVQIRVVDRVSRKELLVEPKEFEGERIELPEKVSTPFGDISVELYCCDGGDTDGGVAIGKDGTRVLRDITDLVQFQRAPWTQSRIEGILDFPAFELAPGTRGGIVPDEKLDAFIDALRTLESSVVEALEQRAQAESDKASRDILKQVHRAFRNALRELPSNEYVFFDIPETHRALGTVAARNKANGEKGPDGLPVPDSMPDQSRDESIRAPERPLLPLEPGPLATVSISPRHARRRLGEECELTATSRDEHGLVLPDLQYTWNIVEGEATLSTDGHRARVRAEEISQVVLQVLAQQDQHSATDQVTVKFLEFTERGDDAAKGLPAYRLEAEHGKPWRSRYNATQNEIIINSAHRDFLSSKTTGAKHRRYIGKLYAKEVVLINFPHESPAQVMERLIQVTLRTEDVL